jgi:hypothetical protein
MVRRIGLLLLLLAAAHRSFSEGGQTGPYFPPAGTWARKAPAELGLDPAKLAEAVTYAQSRESTRAIDFSDQEKTFGTMLGSLPTKRAKTNGLVIYKGYVVVEFGDTTWADPTYSVAKSMMSSVTGIAVRDGKIANLNDPVGATVKDGGYDSPHNAQITWKMHLQQETEWEHDPDLTRARPGRGLALARRQRRGVRQARDRRDQVALTDSPVLVEVDTDVLLQPADHLSQQGREPLVLSFQIVDAHFE